ncbi:unnamed protein product [Boreogadus saida]
MERCSGAAVHSSPSLLPQQRTFYFSQIPTHRPGGNHNQPQNASPPGLTLSHNAVPHSRNTFMTNPTHTRQDTSHQEYVPDPDHNNEQTKGTADQAGGSQLAEIEPSLAVGPPPDLLTSEVKTALENVFPSPPQPPPQLYGHFLLRKQPDSGEARGCCRRQSSIPGLELQTDQGGGMGLQCSSGSALCLLLSPTRHRAVLLWVCPVSDTGQCTSGSASALCLVLSDQTQGSVPLGLPLPCVWSSLTRHRAVYLWVCTVSGQREDQTQGSVPLGLPCVCSSLRPDTGQCTSGSALCLVLSPTRHGAVYLWVCPVSAPLSDQTDQQKKFCSDQNTDIGCVPDELCSQCGRTQY